MKQYLVGGAVRDLLMGNPIQDRDYVVVGASPQEMLAMGYEQVGADFPVFLHPFSGEEYALARTERKTGAGYHGFAVDYNDDVTLEDDLARRDLTINAIAMDEETAQFIDPFDGIDDINKRVLRHVSSAFKEDPLRVIRLARFYGRFENFTVAPVTMRFAQDMVIRGELNELPWERFAAEIVKVLKTCTVSGCMHFFKLLHELQVAEHVNFFRGLNMLKLAEIAGWVRSQALPMPDRIVAFTALVRGDSAFSVQVGGAEGWAMVQLINQNREAARTAYDLSNLLRRIGWQNEKRVELFVKISNGALKLNIAQTFTGREMLSGFDLAQPLASKLAPVFVADGMSGKEIGEGIEAARQGALISMLQPAERAC
jgi:tRNA nucleotidyltransferase/poly(A) polymerase